MIARPSWFSLLRLKRLKSEYPGPSLVSSTSNTAGSLGSTGAAGRFSTLIPGRSRCTVFGSCGHDDWPDVVWNTSVP